jgi:hypothetical protein
MHRRNFTFVHKGAFNRTSGKEFLYNESSSFFEYARRIRLKGRGEGVTVQSMFLILRLRVDSKYDEWEG